MIQMNPLAGITVPSCEEMAEKIVRLMGRGKVDLADVGTREMVKGLVREALSSAFCYEFLRTIQQANEKAMKHVFSLMRDSKYQEKKQQRRKTRMEFRKHQKLMASHGNVQVN